MKRLIGYALHMLLLAAICGCGKKGDPVSELYTITGLSDVTVRQFSDTTFTAVYHIAYPAGLYELVTFKVDEVPPGVIVSPDFASDTTSFSVAVTYKVLMPVAASYKVGITLYSGSQGKKQFSFRINVREAQPFGYSLTVPAGVTLARYSDTIVKLAVTASYLGGANEPVSVTASDLPDNAVISPVSLSGIPTFTDTFLLHVTANDISSGQVVLHSTSSQGVQAASFNLTVEDRADCAPALADTFSGNTVCSGYGGPGTGYSAVSATIYGTNKLLIRLPFADAITELSCSAASLNMLPGPAGGITFGGGTGTFNASMMVLHYALSGAVNSTCTTTLHR